MNLEEFFTKIMAYFNLNNLANVIEIGTFIVAVLIWFKVRAQNKHIIEAAKITSPKLNLKESIEYHSNIHSFNPIAFAVSLTENVKSITPQVSNFLKIKGWDKKISIRELTFDGLNQDNLEEFVNKLKENKRAFMAESVTEIHLRSEEHTSELQSH